MRPSSLRPTSIAVVLGLTTVLAGVLALEALTAARDHRHSAEQVLSDYAALGAEGVGGRTQSYLASRLYPLLSAASGPGSTPPTIETLRVNLGMGAREVLDRSNRILWMAPHAGGAMAAGEPLPMPGDSLVAMVTRISQALPPTAYFGATWISGTSGREFLVFQPLRDSVARIAGVTIPVAGLAALLSKTTEARNVLPASLTHGETVQSGIGLRVAGQGVTVVNDRYDEASPYRGTFSLGSMYGDLAVDVSLSESLAPTLVIGGLPRSRVPLLGALLILTVMLTIAAGYQLGRERELARLREDFVASVSHELRTPLAQIRLFAETLRLGRIRSEAERDRSLEIVEHESKRLEHLVENVLHFSRAERGAQQIRPEPTDLTALVEQIVVEFTPLGERTGSFFRLALAPEVTAPVDRAAIRQVLLNLLDNAIKYGPRGQVITVRLAANHDRVQLEVEDQGPGVPVRARGRVWERFWRDETVRAAGVTGTGIGLAIVSDLVELHGGTATIVDATPTGARVIITLRSRLE